MTPSSKHSRQPTDPAEGAAAMRSPTPDAGRVRAAVDVARRRAPPPVLRVITRTAGGLQHADPFDRGMTLAAQAFTSIFPLIISIAALLPDSSRSLPDRISDALGIRGSSRAVSEQALPAYPDTRGAFGIIGVLIVVVSIAALAVPQAVAA
jgi:membrane protein